MFPEDDRTHIGGGIVDRNDTASKSEQHAVVASAAGPTKQRCALSVMDVKFRREISMEEEVGHVGEEVGSMGFTPPQPHPHQRQSHCGSKQDSMEGHPAPGDRNDANVVGNGSAGADNVGVPMDIERVIQQFQRQIGNLEAEKAQTKL